MRRPEPRGPRPSAVAAGSSPCAEVRGGRLGERGSATPAPASSAAAARRPRPAPDPSPPPSAPPPPAGMLERVPRGVSRAPEVPGCPRGPPSPAGTPLCASRCTPRAPGTQRPSRRRKPALRGAGRPRGPHSAQAQETTRAGRPPGSTSPAGRRVPGAGPLLLAPRSTPAAGRRRPPLPGARWPGRRRSSPRARWPG